jgi:hypothetical protein
MDSAMVRAVIVNKEKIRYFFTKGTYLNSSDVASVDLSTRRTEPRKKKKKKNLKIQKVANSRPFGTH